MTQGTHIAYKDGKSTRYGIIVRYARASRHPWNVYYVRRDDGIGNPQLQPNGEVLHVVEVHPDRILNGDKS